MPRFEFRAVQDPDDPLVQQLADTDPRNPFYTPQNVALARMRGLDPWLLYLTAGEAVVSGCVGILRKLPRSQYLEIMSAPTTRQSEVFWDGLRGFCRSIGVTNLVLNSYASRSAQFPNLGREIEREQRVEYLYNLSDPALFKNISNNHRRRIKKARKAGMVVHPVTDLAAFDVHAGLINSSMDRRRGRGENVPLIATGQRYLEVVQSGSGTLYQAVLDDRALSSLMILRSQAGGYDHSQGTNQEGMDIGAAHLIIHEVACVLRDEGKEVFNLGGATADEPGLIRFKTGFGGGLETVSLEAVNFSTAGILRRAVLAGRAILMRR